jgi:hypothetical protein
LVAIDAVWLDESEHGEIAVIPALEELPDVERDSLEVKVLDYIIF